LGMTQVWLGCWCEEEKEERENGVFWVDLCLFW